MNLFISWSGLSSGRIAKEFRDWLPMINQHIQPYMSEEDVEKGSHWSANIRHELESTSYGIVILTPENTHSIWLHFEAGAIAKSVEEGRLAPVLFALKPSDVPQPLSLFQTTLFDEADILRLIRSINLSAGEEARTDRDLERVFLSLWPQLKGKVEPQLNALVNPAARAPQHNETDRILQEMLTLVRQQARILANPEELFGREVLSLLVRLVHDAEGAVSRLKTRERDLGLALTARWSSYVRELRRYLEAQPETSERIQIVSGLNNFRRYLSEFEQTISRDDGTRPGGG